MFCHLRTRPSAILASILGNSSADFSTPGSPAWSYALIFHLNLALAVNLYAYAVKWIDPKEIRNMPVLLAIRRFIKAL